MNIVVDIISEYLRSNRRLVVPTFGAFMVKESGERIFSDLLNTDDGVLASLLHAKGLSEMEVAVTIDRFIFELRHELEEYGYCRLGEIGTLRVEPTTKVLKLYPPVQGELPKQTPYVPKSLETRDGVSGTSEIDGTNETNGTNGQNTITPKSPKSPNASNTPNASKAPTKPRKKSVDLVMVAAIVILLAALAGIGYGWYVSNLGGEDDDAAAMDALRVAPEQTINE
ncbi:MAG: hypothetical protein E7141_06825 [Rikenellaceae bacterium]|nr:hypothetical protein [Rikenellaceae bacterium]